ncbi:MAG: hypothetical protein APR63_00215 [Desulfuromonas sp. SDB]|nr:MAG: hypothetical protein APR63_00215 [Desulfuromonas sp. SDB]
MDRKIFIITLVLFLFSSILSAGWTQYYGEIDDETGFFVQQTLDGGYILTGHTTSWGSEQEDVFLIKTNQAGDISWLKTFGGVDQDEGHSVQQCSDEGYIICGQTYSYGAGNADVYLIKTDECGNLCWTKTIGGINSDGGHGIRQTSDGGFILTGITSSYGSGTDTYLVKTDSLGNTQWSRYFGGSDMEFGYSVLQTQDGGYIVCGGTCSFGAGQWDIYLIKTDQNGNAVWTKTYGDTGTDIGYSIKQTSDCGYIITGLTDSYGAGLKDVYLIKTDSCGDSIWAKTYGGSENDFTSSIDITPSGNFIVTGVTNSYGAGSSDIYLLYLTSSGNPIWTKTFGGINADIGICTQHTAEGGFILTGATESFGSGGSDIILIKTDINGVAVEESVISPPNQINYSIKSLDNNDISLELSLPQTSDIRLDIYDVSGRYISTPLDGSYTPGIHNISFNMEKQGVYFFNLKFNQSTHQGKFTVI